MNINLKTKNIQTVAEIKSYLEEKISNLIEKYLANLDKKENLQIDCEISRQTHHQKGNIFYVEINLNVPGKFLRAAKHSPDIRMGIDLAEADLKRQIKKYREVKKSKIRKKWVEIKNLLREFLQ